MRWGRTVGRKYLLPVNWGRGTYLDAGVGTYLCTSPLEFQREGTGQRGGDQVLPGPMGAGVDCGEPRAPDLLLAATTKTVPGQPSPDHEPGTRVRVLAASSVYRVLRTCTGGTYREPSAG